MSERSYVIRPDMKLVKKGGIVATGSVSIGDAIVFRAEVREAPDPDTGEITWFLVWPQCRSDLEGVPYVVICRPEGNTLKATIQEAVFAQIRDLEKQSARRPEINILHISLISEERSDGLQGTADILVDGLIIHDLHIVEWDGSLFVTMPKYAEDGTGTMKQISFLKEEVQERITEAVLNAFQWKNEMG